MKKGVTPLVSYVDLLRDIRTRIQAAQSRAVLAANAQLIQLYWDIGRILAQQQTQKCWGSKVIPTLAKDLKNDLPELKGFSERNIGSMIAFFKAYPNPKSILQQAAEKLGVKANLQQPTTIMTQAAAQFQTSKPQAKQTEYLV